MRAGPLAALGISVVIILLVIGAGDVHSVERDDWRGFSRFRQALEDHGFRTASVRYLPSVEEMNQSVLIVGGMSRRYSDGELAAVLRFHERGGVLVVFDDTGMSNQILERITTMRINGTALD